MGLSWVSKGGFWLVEAGGDEEPAVGVELHAVGAAGGFPVVDQLLRGEIDRAVGVQVEAPELAGAADGVVIVVGDEEVFVVRRDDEAVGAIDFVGDDARDLAVGIDAIDAFDRLAGGVEHLHSAAVAVLRIGEVDAALRSRS